MKKLTALIVTLIILCTVMPTFAEKDVYNSDDKLSASDETQSDITSEDLTDSDMLGSDATESDSASDVGEAVDKIVVNGGFDHGIEGWEYYAYSDGDGSVIAPYTDAVQGECLYLSVPKSNDARAQQLVSVKPNTYYCVSALVKTKGVTGGNGASLSIDGIHNAYSETLHGDNDWTTLTINGITGPNQYEFMVSLRIGGYSAESSGEAWFDDVKVTELKEKPNDYISFQGSGRTNDAVAQDNKTEKDEEKIINYDAVAYGVLLLAIIAVIYIGVTRRVGPKKIKADKSSERDRILKSTDTKLHFTRKDTIFITALTVIYAATAFINTGTTKAPSNEWCANLHSEPAKITFEKEEQIQEIYIFGAVLGEKNEGGTVRITDAEGNELCTYKQIFRNMYRWYKVYSQGVTTSSITITPTGGEVDFKEIAFFNAAGDHIYGTANGYDAALVDEPDMIPDVITNKTGMYFDELYHGRTAYEHLNFLESYENSHPPLGKLIISIGIAIFGMNPFGWRIMGVLFGIGMVPIMYCFAKRVFKKSEYALITAGLFAFDFMHFTQTRIATIDVYGVFFILLMFCFMYKYFTMSFYRDGLIKTLIPLGLSGLFFGLGAASKWICFYAGAGLAVILLISFIQRGIEYYKYKNSADTELRNAVSAYWKNVIITVVFCIGFFIIIPVIIYALAYFRYPDVIDAYKTEGIKGYISKVWDYQEFMFRYHSGLTSTHTYQSTWYQWMTDSRPIWYSISYLNDGNIATISAMGNPIVWWLALIGTFGLAVQTIRGRVKLNETVIMIFIGVLCNLLPWMAISRSAFIYHYFATVPFIILGAMYFIKSLEEEHEWFAYFKWYWLGAALLLFAMFFPVISGIIVTRDYVAKLQWMKSWWFIGVEAEGNTGIISGIVIVAVIAVTAVVMGCILAYQHRKKILTKHGVKRR